MHLKDISKWGRDEWTVIESWNQSAGALTGDKEEMQRTESVGGHQLHTGLGLQPGKDRKWVFERWLKSYCTCSILSSRSTRNLHSHKHLVIFLKFSQQISNIVMNWSKTMLWRLAEQIIFPTWTLFQAEPPKKPSNWRQKHEDFIASIRASKVAFQALKEGKELPPPPPPTYDPGNAWLCMWNRQVQDALMLFYSVLFTVLQFIFDAF